MNHIKSKQKTEPKKVTEPQLCVNCKHSSFDQKFENLSITGTPTLMICPFEQWKLNLNARCVNKKYEKK